MVRQEIPLTAFVVDAWIVRLTEDEPEFLLIRRTAEFLNGTWQMVSGKLEQGETAWQAALREIAEETGLRPERFYSLDRVNTFYDHGSNQIMLVPCFLAIVAPDAEPVLSPEHDDHAWVSAAQARETVLFGQHRETIDVIVDEFLTRTPPAALLIEMPLESGQG